MVCRFKKVVIWGHKPPVARRLGIFPRGRHTHSYIHEGFFKGFRNLGFETFWFDNDDDVSGFDFTNSLFLTEDQVQSKIPLLKSATYILHHTPPEKFLNTGSRIINLCNYVRDVEDGDSFNYPGSTVSKLSDLVFFDEKNLALYQPWATNLLPGEIRDDFFWEYNSSQRNINYIGTIGHEDLPLRFKSFRKPLEAAGNSFNVYSKVDEIVSQSLVESSRISVDIRGGWHIARGYIPCRVWKSLSYGKFIGSNSPTLFEVFGGRIHINSDESTLFESTEDAYRSLSKSKMLETIAWTKQNHTYVNRANSILQVLHSLD